MRAAVVIPVWNEAEAIGPVVREVRDVAARLGAPVMSVIVADGGSADGTPEQAEAAGAIAIDGGRGYGRACLCGAEAADADVIVFMDGDGADDPRHLGGLLRPIAEGRADFVIGSRVRGRRQSGAMAWHQVAAGHGAGLVMTALYRVRYSDMCAFRAIRRDALLGLGMREMTYGWNIEMQMRAARAGLRIEEIPVDGRARLAGSSKVAGTLGGTIRAGARILATIARVATEGRVAAQTPC